MDTIITPHAFPNPGGQKFVPDGTEYSLRLGASAGATPSVLMPDAFFNRPRVYYQKQEPDCGANGGAFMASYLDEHPQQIYSPDAQWVDIKTIDGFPPSAGTDMKSIFKSLLSTGSLPYAMLPEQTDLPLAQFSAPSRLTSAMRAEMSNHKIAAYGFHTGALTMQDLKDLIYQNGSVLVLIELGDEFWTDKNGRSSWAEKDILPLRTPHQVVSGHFIVLGAFDTNYIYFANWWSDQWGRKGYGYLGENYLPQIVQVGTIVDSVSKVSVPYFNRDLALDMTGSDVTALQRWLNAQGFPVAPSGHPGSAGMETTFYGPATDGAVKELQAAVGIVSSGNETTTGFGRFGPKTREYVNAHR